MKTVMLIVAFLAVALFVLSWSVTEVAYRSKVKRGSVGTHTFNIAAPWMGQIKAGRLCGISLPIPGASLKDRLKFRIDTAVGMGVMYAFTCPEPGKDPQ